MSSDTEGDLNALISLAETILSKGQSSPQGLDEFLDSVNDYLSLLENWQTRLKDSPLEGDTIDLKSKLEKLSKLHLEITNHTNFKKESIASDMANLHKKAKAHKQYIDRYPSRITITGKRKG